MFDVPVFMAHLEQLLGYRISVAPSQGGQSYSIAISIEQAFGDKFVDLMISFRSLDGLSGDTMKKAQAEHEGISLALGC